MFEEYRNEIVSYLTDRVIDQLTEYQEKGFNPSTVIIGQLENDALMEHSRRNPTALTTKNAFNDGSTICDLNIVFDHTSKSRCDVVLNAGYIIHRLIQRKGHPMITKDGG